MITIILLKQTSNKIRRLDSRERVADEEYVIYLYKLYPSVGGNKLITGFDAFNKGFN